METDTLTDAEQAVKDALLGLAVMPGPFTASSEAVAVVARLRDAGWTLDQRTPLPTGAAARNGDPHTARIAAASIDDLTDRQNAVYQALSEGACSDEVLHDRYQRLASRDSLFGAVFPPQTAQSIRSRRAELVRAGHVEATGVLGETANGRPCMLWRVV